MPAMFRSSARYFFAFVAAVFVLSAAHAASGPHIFQRPAISKDMIAFGYADDLWVVPRTGGSMSQGRVTLPPISSGGRAPRDYGRNRWCRHRRAGHWPVRVDQRMGGSRSCSRVGRRDGLSPGNRRSRRVATRTAGCALIADRGVADCVTRVEGDKVCDSHYSASATH